jgi:hypothetical protein
MAKGISLHIGVNTVDPGHYAGWSGPLQACEADAESLNKIAESAGYDSTVLLTAAATRSAVIERIRAAATALSEGDMFLLSYSGHGGQVPDFEDEEADLRDETWCLYDGQLIDDELRELFARLQPGVRAFVLSDSCHSGSVTREQYDTLTAVGALSRPVSGASGPSPPVFRAMPNDAAFSTFDANRDVYLQIAERLPRTPSPVQATVRLISGCQDNQLSADGVFNGLFTGTLLRVWNAGAFKGNYAAFHKAIVKRMPPTQTPNHFVQGLPNAAFDAEKPFSI